MKTSSAKSKGRRAAAEVKELLYNHSHGLQEGDFIITSSSVTGRDLLLSPLALQQFPFAIEVKNQEKLSIWEALKQAETHVQTDRELPLLFFKRNRSELYVALKAHDFLNHFKKRAT